MAEYKYHIFSPYRISLFGEEFQGQHSRSMGFALDEGIHLHFTPEREAHIKLESVTYENTLEFDLTQEFFVKRYDWADYLLAANEALRRVYPIRHGFTGVIDGSLKSGAALTPSASCLTAYLMALAKSNNLNLSDKEIIKFSLDARKILGEKTSSEFYQACCVFAEEGCLFSYDSATGDYNNFPFGDRFTNVNIALFYSGLRGSQNVGEYKQLDSKCKVLAWNLLAYEGKELGPLEDVYLGDVLLNTYTDFTDKFEVLPKKISNVGYHLLSEYKRLVDAEEYFLIDDPNQVSDAKVIAGKYLTESCDSVIKYLDAGCEQLRTLHNIASTTDGIYGGKFFNGGFKGSYMALVDKKNQDAIVKSVTDRYLMRYPELKDDFKVKFVSLGSGARFIED